MRIRRKIAYGYIILILLLLLILLYQYGLAQRMLTGIRRFSEVDFVASIELLRSYQGLDGLKEFVEKFLATGDDRYAVEIVQRMHDIDGDIEDLEQYDLEPEVRQELLLLKKRWANLSDVTGRILIASTDHPKHSDPEVFRIEFEHEFQLAKRHAGEIFDQTRDAVEISLNSQEALGEQARQFALMVLAIGLGLSLLLSFLVVRSVSKPLLQLTRGTRRLAQGDFAVLVDESGKDELAELAAHFNVMVSKLRELDQLKGDFVSHVSHELKAPLASMQETTRLLMDEIPGGLNEKQRRLLKLNLACGERLSEMIKNLLDLSKIEADAMQYQFEISDLAATVEMAVDEFRGLAGEKNLSLEIKLPDEPALIPCDEERCLQVLGNLISNAIKFSDRGKSITVEIQCLDTPPQSIPEVKRHQLLTSSKRFCVISVRDRGRGVSDKDKERIFERFFVLTKGRKNLGQSTGLGLAISRRIAEAHRGLLWVEDNPGGGSVFHFLLPDRVI